MFPSTPAITLDKKLQELERHFYRFGGDVGSLVVFKRPKRPKVVWRVVELQLDPSKIHWREGKVPDYIKLEGLVPDGTGKLTKQTCWTCENRIRLVEGKFS